MDNEIEKRLKNDPDGLLTYEYIANHIDTCEECMDFLVDNMLRVDRSGQFLASAAKYLAAIDREGFKVPVRLLVAGVIEKDREHRYLADLLEGVYGSDYKENAVELCAADDNFRRIYKRLNPATTGL